MFKCFEFDNRTDILSLKQGMEIVQTMNSDPGLAVGKKDFQIIIKYHIYRIVSTRILFRRTLFVLFPRLHCVQWGGL